MRETSSSTLSTREFKNIAVWSSMGIGNTVNFMPMLEGLRQRYPNAHITLLSWSNPDVYQLVDRRVYDKLHYINKKSKIDLWINVLKLFFKSYDLFIVKWHSNKWIARYIRACWKALIIGHVSSAGWKSDFDHLIDVKIKLIEGIADFEQYLSLICPLGVLTSQYSEQLKIPDSSVLRVDKLFNLSGLNEMTKCVGFHMDVGDAQPYKQIGYEKWVQIITDIRGKFPEMKIILLGLSSDPIANRVFSHFIGDKSIVNFLGKLNLSETAALIRRLNLLIGCDSSLKTIASALNVQSVVPYGCTDPSRSAPNGSLIKVVRVDLPCSPCDVLGPTKWEHCEHRSCILNLDAKFVSNAAIKILSAQ